MQSEWYLGPQGQPVDLTKASAPRPPRTSWSSTASPTSTRTAPIEVGTGERNRIFVLNAGPSVDSSFHIVGTIFDTVIKEGVHLTKGNDGSWGSQAMDLSPAQGGIVEFTTAEDGLYPMVTHAFNFVGRGALGLSRQVTATRPTDSLVRSRKRDPADDVRRVFLCAAGSAVGVQLDEIAG